jgi:hypothetical protein
LALAAEWYSIDMRRAAIIIAFLCLLAVLMGRQPKQASGDEYGESSKTSDRANHGPPKWYAAVKEPEWWLVAAAFLTLLVVLRQAREMSKASKEMHRSTEAVQRQAGIMEQQTKAMINAERGWLVVFPSQKPEGYEFAVMNQGRTPAKIIAGDSGHIFVGTIESLPSPPLYCAPFVLPDLTFLVNRDSFPIRPPKNPEWILENSGKKILVQESREFLVFYGRVIYEDVLSGTTNHETRWCFAYDPFRKALVGVGPEEYNRYT